MAQGYKHLIRLQFFCAVASLILFSKLSAEGYITPSEEETLCKNLSYEEQLRYAGLRYILNDHQRMEWLTIENNADRDRWLEKYWKMHDPTPTTRHNERRKEHEERVKTALRQYPKRGFPGWDHRGEVLIRFGEPDIISNIPPNLISAEQQASMGRKSDFGMNMGGEVWHYSRLNMVVPFENVLLNGEHTYYLKIRTADMEQFREWSQAYMAGFSIGGFNFSDVWTDLQESADYSGSNIYNLEFAASQELLNFYYNLANNRYAHSCDIDRKQLGCYYDITSFDGGEGKLRTEVNFEIKAGELSYESTDNGFETDCKVRVKVFDLDMNEIVSGEDSVDVTLSTEPGLESYWLLPAQYVLTLDPGYYRFGIEIKDSRNNRHGSALVSRYIAPMGDALSLSDIQMASSITPSENIGSFIKGKLRVVPHPVRAYKKPNPVMFYFEVYGLEPDVEDLAIFEVEHKITPGDKERTGTEYQNISPAKFSIFQSSGFGSMQPVYLSINTRELQEGNYYLHVRVMDRRTRKSVETMTSFSILE